MQSKNNKSAGFTIVELMIATLVFSVILVAITVAVIQFSKAYYKGVHESATQNAARNIADAVSNAVKYSPSRAASVDYMESDDRSAVCAGGYVFVYKLHEKYTKDDAAATGMYMQPQGKDGCSVAPKSEKSQQLLGNNMRLTDFSLTEVADGMNTLKVSVIYGDDELIVDPGSENSRCTTDRGNEYCAMSKLEATIGRRI